MELVTYNKNQPKCKVPVDFNLFLVSCHHLGSVLCHNKGWTQLVDHINSSIDGLPIKSNRYWDCGDPIEAIDPLDKRFVRKTMELSVLEQIKAAIKCRAKIAWAMLGMNESNHPWKYIRTIGNITENILEDVAEKYNTPVVYGTWASRIAFVTRRNELMFKMFARHGTRSITSVSPDPERRQSYKKFRLKRLLTANRADDCVLQVRGHTHEQIMVEPIRDMYITDDGKELQKVYKKVPHDEEYIDPNLRWYVSPGSFLKTQALEVSGYGEIGEYEPIENGYALCKIRSREIADISFVEV
jgi:hypothetical protein